MHIDRRIIEWCVMLSAFKKVNIPVMSVFFYLALFSIPGYAIHKNLVVTDVDENGIVRRSHNKFFGSCVGCTEIIGDLVATIDANEDWYCTKTDCFFPDKHPTDFDLIIEDPIRWDKNKNLIIHTKGNIIFKNGGKIINENNGSIILKAGMEPGENKEYRKTIKFDNNDLNFIYLEIWGTGKVKFYYNPQGSEKRKHKYHNSESYFYSQYLKFLNRDEDFTAYMLVNNIMDLQHISAFPSGDYALSQDVDAAETQNWARGQGFMPVGGTRQDDMPFTGNFDGNNYTIKNLYINRPDEDNVAIFALSSGRILSNNVISNLFIEKAHVVGNFRVGTVVSESFKTNFYNIYIKDSTIIGYGPVGSVAGTLEYGDAKEVEQDEKTQVFIGNKQVNQKRLFGAVLLSDSYQVCAENSCKQSSVDKPKKEL